VHLVHFFPTHLVLGSQRDFMVVLGLRLGGVREIAD
jgi:hypothetical protein